MPVINLIFWQWARLTATSIQSARGFEMSITEIRKRLQLIPHNCRPIVSFEEILRYLLETETDTNWKEKKIIKDVIVRFVFQWNPTNIHYWDVPWTETNGGWEMIWKKVTDLSCSHQPFNNGSRMTSRSTASIHSSMPTLLMTTTSCEGSGFGTNDQRDSNCQVQIHQLKVQSEIWYVVFWDGELKALALIYSWCMSVSSF